MGHYDDDSDDYMDCYDCDESFHVDDLTYCEHCEERFCSECYEEHQKELEDNGNS